MIPQPLLKVKGSKTSESMPSCAIKIPHYIVREIILGFAFSPLPPPFLFAVF